jgi:hypothetical protein
MLTVSGWNVTEKGGVGATVTMSSPDTPNPTGNMQVPEWGGVKIGDPIYPGSLYTWGDATKEGTRVPESKEVMKGILLMAGELDKISKKYNGGKKVEINSWYRDPATNVAISSSGPAGPHTTGSAVDLYTDNMQQIHDDYDKAWEGGVAISPNSFTHIDWIGHPQGIPGDPRRRWSY